MTRQTPIVAGYPQSNVTCRWIGGSLHLFEVTPQSKEPSREGESLLCTGKKWGRESLREKLEFSRIFAKKEEHVVTVEPLCGREWSRIISLELKDGKPLGGLSTWTCRVRKLEEGLS